MKYLKPCDCAVFPCEHNPRELDPKLKLLEFWIFKQFVNGQRIVTETLPDSDPEAFHHVIEYSAWQGAIKAGHDMASELVKAKALLDRAHAQLSGGTNKKLEADILEWLKRIERKNETKNI